jgi:hypothetical protein
MASGRWTKRSVGAALLLSWWFGFAAALAPSVLSIAGAQEYKKIAKVITNQPEVSKLRREVGNILRSETALTNADEDTLKRYYGMHIIAGMTQPIASTDANQFPVWRKTIIGDLSSTTTSPSRRSFVLDLIYRYANGLVGDRAFSPAARYNALLIISELNDREAQGSGRSVTPAVPMARARTVLLGVLNSDDTQDMKVGALIGLARHARLMAAAGQNPDPKLVEGFTAVLQQTEPKQNETSDGLLWMRRIAIDALGDIGHPGAAPLLQPVVSDDTAPRMLRCAAADALGRLDYSRGANFDAKAAVKGIGQLATESLSEQVAAVQEHLATDSGELLSQPRIEEDNQKRPEDPFVLRVRKELTYTLYCAGRGLTALEKAASDAEAKTAATSVRSAVLAIFKELNNDKLTPQDLLDKIRQPAMQLDSAVKSL